MRVLLANVVYRLIVVLDVRRLTFPCPHSNSYAITLRNRLRFHLRLRLG